MTAVLGRGALLAVLLAAAAPAAALKVETISYPVSLASQARALLGPSASVPAAGTPVEVIAEQAMVKFKASATAAERAAALSATGASVRQDYPQYGWTLVNLPAGTPVLSGMTALQAQFVVDKVEPNTAYRAIATPNDPLVSSQYGLSQVNAFAAWEFDVGSSNLTTIAVVDTGVDITHPDLAAKMPGTIQHRFCDPTAPANDCDPNGENLAAEPQVACEHATAVAGVAAASAQNGTHIAGMSWGAQILSLRAFRLADCNASCTNAGCVTDNAGIIQAVEYAITRHNTANYGRIILNLSLGGSGACNGAVQAAFNNAVAAGIPVIVSAGNTGGAVTAPANCATAVAGTGIIPVGATDSENNIAVFSSRGAELSANGLVAPGVSVLTTRPGGTTGTATGTSFAAPHVAGLASLILSAKPAFTVAQVQSTILSGADGIGVSSLGLDPGLHPLGNISGAGRMNAFRSLRLAVRGTLADFEGDRKAIAFPNPFRVGRDGQVAFTIPLSLQGQNAKIKIYTVAGQLVNELAGLTWNGKNKDGSSVASGTYMFLVTTSAGSTTGRFALIR